MSINRAVQRECNTMQSQLTMSTHQVVLFLLLSVAYLLTCSAGDQISRNSFPPDFIFGAASSAYQYEGATSYEEYGKGPSIWDTFTKEHPEKIKDQSSGEIAEDFYHLYKEDIALVKELGFDSFRFSISWPRILPNGTVRLGVNPKGVQFYNNLIDELLSKGIKPIVTLYHWDLPQALEDKYGGFLSPNIKKDYVDYVDFCFRTYGDRVKQWITFNEPYIFSTGGYATGIRAPGRCSDYAGNCTYGNSGTEPYTVIHHLLLAHAAAVHLYRKRYQATQRGIIGLTETTTWVVPLSNTSEDKLAAYRSLDFQFGWVVNPIIYGDYPKTMRKLVGTRLPKFTKAESKLLKGSIDFLGLNYYTTMYGEDSNTSSTSNPTPTTDSDVTLTAVKDGIPIGQPTPTGWLYVYPEGIEKLLLYIKEKYNNPPVYITENGVVDLIPGDLNDTLRINYHRDHLSHILTAIKGGADVRGYYAWSFLDDFEWESGYTIRFGIINIDFETLARTKKASADWFYNFLGKQNIMNQQNSNALYAA